MACGGSTLDPADNANTPPADAGSSTGGGNLGGPEGGTSLSGCTTTSRPGPDADPVIYDCVGVPGDWTCSCGERPPSPSSATACEEALETVCGVTPSEPLYCVDVIGTCWPAGDAWLCRCTDGDVVEGVTADTCDQAIRATCDTACESAWGHCIPSDEPGSYACSCSYYDADRHLWSSDCATALNQACDPSLGCNTFSGFCDPSEVGFACQCIDGSNAQFTFDSLGHDDCFQAVELACGDVEPPAGWSCEREVGNVRGTCTKDPEEDGRYDCFCSSSSDQSGSAWGNVIDAVTCEEALSLVCFPG